MWQRPKGPWFDPPKGNHFCCNHISSKQCYLHNQTKCSVIEANRTFCYQGVWLSRYYCIQSVPSHRTSGTHQSPIPDKSLYLWFHTPDNSHTGRLPYRTCFLYQTTPIPDDSHTGRLPYRTTKLTCFIFHKYCFIYKTSQLSNMSGTGVVRCVKQAFGCFPYRASVMGGLTVTA